MRGHRGRIRVVRGYLRDAVIDRPEASMEEIRTVVEGQLRDDFGEDESILVLLLKVLLMLLPLFIEGAE